MSDLVTNRNIERGPAAAASGTNSIFVTKPLDLLLHEAAESGEHTLKRTLGPVSLTALGVGAIIGAGIFVLSGLGAHYAGPGLPAFAMRNLQR
jgi:amino acid permease